MKEQDRRTATPRNESSSGMYRRTIGSKDCVSDVDCLPSVFMLERAFL